jgi:hypothetical protein
VSISATIVADSLSEHSGKRLTTFALRYPRFVHAEVMTHRVFSRNASSSRAIPIQRMMKDIMEEPALPVRWGKNGKGMQDHGELSPDQQEEAKRLWLLARDHTLSVAGKMLLMKEVPHKQVVNRLLEPWQHIHVVVTSTEWTNFYALRADPEADPTIEALAEAMWEAHQNSEPNELRHGQWHLPFTKVEDRQLAREYLIETQGAFSEGDIIRTLIKMSTARSARVSYANHLGKVPTVAEDVDLHDRLVAEKAVKKHASPSEHQATPDTGKMIPHDGPTRELRWAWDHPHLHGNLNGFCQYRKTLVGENIASFRGYVD